MNGSFLGFLWVRRGCFGIVIVCDGIGYRSRDFELSFGCVQILRRLRWIFDLLRDLYLWFLIGFVSKRGRRKDRNLLLIEAVAIFGDNRYHTIVLCLNEQIRCSLSILFATFIWRSHQSRDMIGRIFVDSFDVTWRRNCSMVEYKSMVLVQQKSHLSQFYLYLFGASSFFHKSFWLSVFPKVFEMSQSLALGQGSNASSSMSSVMKKKVKIPYFDNIALIEGYSKTVVGRCMNPRRQDMKSLLHMFPQIWHLEGRVVGADLGMGKFQFDFDEESDGARAIRERSGQRGSRILGGMVVLKGHIGENMVLGGFTLMGRDLLRERLSEV
ncbi:PREDICTED: uncharacterized protein LOC109130422 [Camelina sativa]|uniref:Uncharacterized protein LOC109130422 n=1 Tax=Camelina sativa TaxID=90675 RepID=A0ABM1R8W6_CAMSA|nr:PREDICTED: uncharacterized protein LOC109130422 [Camelina sativa]XP_019095455.1 PREDICTED: uncharacterized protein LOC109130422 [Camelina sativa]XP_019095456.1 PREDICTED: uncharacterized protein LOC109130422 [Camelina sativa]